MKVKKFGVVICVILSVLMMVSANANPELDNPQEPEEPENPYSILDTYSATLSKSGSTANVAGSIYSVIGTSKVTIKLELQKKYNDVARIQGELDELRQLIKGHEDDPDFVDPATGEPLSKIQAQISEKNKAITDFQVEVQSVQDQMEDVKNNLLAPIKARYKSILEAFIREKKQNERISYIIIDKKDVVCADLAFDITNIIEERIKDDNERRARNRRNNAAGEPISEQE